MKKKWGRISFLAAALLLGLCGCQQKENKEEMGTEKEIMDKWEDQWTTVLDDGRKIPVEMDCEINTSEQQPDSVVDVHPFEMNSQNKESMAKGVFGDEVYLYDIEHMSQDDLQIRLHREEMILEKALPQLEDLVEIETKESIAYRKKTTKELKDRVKRVKKCLKTAPEKPIPVQDGEYTGDSYMGYIDEVPFRLEFNRKDKSPYDFYDDDGLWEDSQAPTQTIELLPVDAGYFAPEELANAQNISSWTYGSDNVVFNKCSLSEEEAQEKAEAMLKKLGLNDMARVNMYYLAWKDVDVTDSTKQDLVNGYVFDFRTAVDGHPLQTFEGFAEDLDYGAESVQVQVADKGVVRVIMDAPIEVDSITPDVKILGFKDIQDMFKTQMASYIREYVNRCFEKYMELYERYEDEGRLTKKEKEQGKEKYAEEAMGVFLDGGFKGTYLQRIYCRINDPDKGQHYTFLPVYELTGFDGQQQLHKLLVNAVDGSFVTFAR